MPVFAIAGIEIVVVIVALAILLLLLAGDKFFQLIANVLQKVPVIGDTLANTITSTVGAAIKAVAGVWERQTVAIGELLWSGTVGLWHLLYEQVDGILHMYQWLGNLAASIPKAVAYAIHQANAYTDHAIQTQVGNVADVLPGLEAQIAALPAEIAAGEAAAEALAHSLSDQVLNQALDMFRQAEATAAAEAAAAEALAQALADQVQSEAVTLFGQAEGAITIIQGQVQALPGQIEGVIPGIIDGIVPGIIAGAIPGILSQVIPRVQALEGEVTECLDPLCDTVTPNAPRLGHLGDLFRLLEDLGIEALILAMAAEALHNPGAVADDVVSVVDAVGSPIMAGFRDLIGG